MAVPFFPDENAVSFYYSRKMGQKKTGGCFPFASSSRQNKQIFISWSNSLRDPSSACRLPVPAFLQALQAPCRFPPAPIYPPDPQHTPEIG
jgi:hypothetical protein